jgi:hypothetical protein
MFSKKKLDHQYAIEVESYSLGDERTVPIARLSVLPGLSVGINAYPFSVFPEIFEGDNSVNFGKKGVVTAATYVGARMDFGPELAYQNVAGLNHLSAEALHPTPLPCTVPAVSGTATCFLMSHLSTPHLG